MRQDMHDKNNPLHFELTESILGICFEVMNELGSGFLESVYKNAVYVALKENGFTVEIEKRFEVVFRGKKVGLYIADLIVEGSVIVELKCCEKLLGEHQAQLINYLKASNIRVGLLINFGKRKKEFKRVHHPDYPAACDPAYHVFSCF